MSELFKIPNSHPTHQLFWEIYWPNISGLTHLQSWCLVGSKCSLESPPTKMASGPCDSQSSAFLAPVSPLIMLSFHVFLNFYIWSLFLISPEGRNKKSHTYWAPNAEVSQNWILELLSFSCYTHPGENELQHSI